MTRKHFRFITSQIFETFTSDEFSLGIKLQLESANYVMGLKKYITSYTIFICLIDRIHI